MVLLPTKISHPAATAVKMLITEKVITACAKVAVRHAVVVVEGVVAQACTCSTSWCAAHHGVHVTQPLVAKHALQLKVVPAATSHLGDQAVLDLTDRQEVTTTAAAYFSNRRRRHEAPSHSPRSELGTGSTSWFLG